MESNRKLFGLPPNYLDFVAKVKVGMLLFLFEYDKRILHGVFQATSDGGENIVPNAYCSTGRLFPAQARRSDHIPLISVDSSPMKRVRIATLWHCRPITEDQFHAAIKENHFAPHKFNFGLSKNQVYKLLCLFNGRRDKIPQNVSHIKSDNQKQIWTTRSEEEEQSSTSAKRKLETDSDIQSVLSSEGLSPTSVCDTMEKLNSCSKSFTENSKKLKLSSEITIQEPEKLKVSSKEILGDFIALSTSDDSDTEQGEISFSEAGSFQKSVIKSSDFDSVSNPFGLPTPKLVGEICVSESCVFSLPEAVDDSLNEKAFGLKSQVLVSNKNKELDNSRHFPLVSGLYSDKLAKKSSVFSRLGFPSEGKPKTSIVSHINFFSKGISLQNMDFTKEGNASGHQTKHGNKKSKPACNRSQQRVHHDGRDKSMKEILTELQRMHKEWGTEVKISNSVEQQDESYAENNRISAFLRLA
ncbi:hypothetical protein ACFE04_004759 [Oxalis oulophora]